MQKLTIKQIRIGMNMTQEEFAELIGMNVRTYQCKERGETKFYFDEIEKICEVSGTSIDYVK